MADRELPQEFLLAVACCRWPLTGEATDAIRGRLSKSIDWDYFLRIVRRQRVAGLVSNALSAAGIVPPPEIAERLLARARHIASRNLALASETARLQSRLNAVHIPAAVLKGVALAQLAYGSLSLKHSKDIDLLVPPSQAEQALQLLEQEGYALRQPAGHLSHAQRRAVIRHSVEFTLRRAGDGIQVELRWRPAENPLLLRGVDTGVKMQAVTMPGYASIRTLGEDDLFAYLCVHGASHGWSRLKWLADLNALVAPKSGAELERLYRHAQTIGSGRCAGLAFALCHRLLGLKLPAQLAQELANGRLEMLASKVLNVMAAPDGATELEDRAFGSTRVSLMQFFLGEGWRYHAAQLRALCVRPADVINRPLPPALHFIYPLLRIAPWLRRRIKPR